MFGYKNRIWEYHNDWFHLAPKHKKDNGLVIALAAWLHSLVRVQDYIKFHNFMAARTKLAMKDFAQVQNHSKTIKNIVEKTLINGPGFEELFVAPPNALMRRALREISADRIAVVVAINNIIDIFRGAATQIKMDNIKEAEALLVEAKESPRAVKYEMFQWIPDKASSEMVILAAWKLALDEALDKEGRGFTRFVTNVRDTGTRLPRKNNRNNFVFEDTLGFSSPLAATYAIKGAFFGFDDTLSPEEGKQMFLNRLASGGIHLEHSPPISSPISP